MCSRVGHTKGLPLNTVLPYGAFHGVVYPCYYPECAFETRSGSRVYPQ